MTIERLPGAELTPKVLLAQVLEDADRLKSIIIIKEWTEGTCNVAWSRQQMRDVAFGIHVLSNRLRQVIEEPVEGDFVDAAD